MVILDGKALAAKNRKILKTKIELLTAKGIRAPKLVVVLVGNNEASLVYVKHKMKTATEVGIISQTIHLPENTTHDELYQTIDQLNHDDSVDGVLLQLPLPISFIEEEYLQAIDVKKDVDGFHYEHQGKMLQGYDTIFPCTPLGVVELLQAYNISFTGKNAVILGTSNIVGKPLGVMLLNLGATVTFCNKNTIKIKNYTSKADILISATGKKFIITADMVKPNSVIVDIGIVRDPITNKLVGDVDFEKVAPLASYITPVPGGVGPMTVITLMENTYKLYLENINK